MPKFMGLTVKLASRFEHGKLTVRLFGEVRHGPTGTAGREVQIDLSPYDTSIALDAIVATYGYENVQAYLQDAQKGKGTHAFLLTEGIS